MDHDHAYKRLFSQPELVADLLRGFVHESWVDQLDLTTLEPVSATYVSDDLREREDDVVWRARWGEGWLYVYLLLEFQSTVDRYMAVRLLTYLGLLYQDLIKAGATTAEGLLPPVLPVVLYNGEKRWRAPTEVADLIATVPGGLEAYRPDFRYLLLDEGAYADSELAASRNLAAAVFRMENSRRPEDLQTVVRRLREWLQAPEQQDLRRAFSVWLGRVLIPGRFGGADLPPTNDLEEMETMLAERVKEWQQEWKEQGLEEGRQQGEARVLINLLEAKFGPLTPVQRRRIEEADTETLLAWSGRILTVESVEEVFR
jgi:hypothetical protein